jgi:hypothetical protein
MWIQREREATVSKRNRQRRQQRKQGQGQGQGLPVIPTTNGEPGREPIVYQVDLFGPNALRVKDRLSNMVHTWCSGCGVFLLAEGNAFLAAVNRARAERRNLYPVCAACFREVMGLKGLPDRTLPPDYRHEEEFASALAQLKGRR